jgi:hypothetical protein
MQKSMCCNNGGRHGHGCWELDHLAHCVNWRTNDYLPSHLDTLKTQSARGTASRFSEDEVGELLHGGKQEPQEIFKMQ